ncbi:hypothetical protein [Fictibacillus gelatini]|uniref:lmo0954 family membrane protein n=1 Tax=Fictibacillus gelatini TaxID=225985 RepID=UPI00040B8C4D|nr:hypothetical protein [Fictibacillus gelatini]
MKKFGLLLVGGIAAIVLLANLGPMIGLAISLVILYFAFKKFMRSETTSGKIGWAIIGLIALCASVSNVPSIIGLIAIWVLYVVYKQWNDNKSVDKEPEDPFASFEKQWKELKQFD